MSNRCDDMSLQEFNGYDMDANGYISVKDMLAYNASHHEVAVDPYNNMPLEIKLQFAIGKCDVDSNSDLSMEEYTLYPTCKPNKK